MIIHLCLLHISSRIGFDLKLFLIDIRIFNGSQKIVAQCMFKQGWQKLRVARAETKLKKAIITI